MKESGEMYLETAYVLSEKGTLAIKSAAIAKSMHVSRPSVKRGMDVLKDAGFVEQDYYGDVRLTSKGIEKAEGILRKHKTITRFLINSLGLDPKTAEEDACKIEHVISDQAVDLMEKKIELFLKPQK